MALEILTEAAGGFKPNIFVYGASGTGKSTAIRTCAARVLIIQTEPGVCTPLSRALDATVPCVAEIVAVVRPRSWQDIRGLTSGVTGWLKSNKLPTEFDILMLDSLTELELLAKADSLTTNPPRGNSDNIPEIANFNMIMERVRQTIYALSASPYGTYVTCQAAVKDIGPEANRQNLWTPALVGEHKYTITHKFDMVFYSYLEGQTPHVRACNTAITLGKTRGIPIKSKLPFSFSDIQKLWESI